MGLSEVCVLIDSKVNVYLKAFISSNNTVKITRKSGIFVPNTHNNTQRP